MPHPHQKRPPGVGGHQRPARAAGGPARQADRLPAAPLVADKPQLSCVNSLAFPAHARDNPAACTLLGG
eukprot:2822488-Prymnesium_polylepis.1